MSDLEMQKQAITAGHVQVATDMIHEYIDTHIRPEFLEVLGALAVGVHLSASMEGFDGCAERLRQMAYEMDAQGRGGGLG